MLGADYCFCCIAAKLCPTLCNLVACSPAGSSVHGISQARIWSGGVISFPRGFSQPRDWTWVTCFFCIAGRVLLLSHKLEKKKKKSLSFHITNDLRCLFLQSINIAVNWVISVTSLPEKNSLLYIWTSQYFCPYSKQ